MRWIISAISTISKSYGHVEADSSYSLLKTKPSKEQRDAKESKYDKTKKESDISTDEMSGWRPWHHVWPKDANCRYPLVPLYNPGGKYCVKIFWMVFAATSIEQFIHLTGMRERSHREFRTKFCSVD